MRWIDEVWDYALTKSVWHSPQCNDIAAAPPSSAVKNNRDSQSIDEYAELLLGYALIAEGSELVNPTEFNQAVTKLMAESM